MKHTEFELGIEPPQAAAGHCGKEKRRSWVSVGNLAQFNSVRADWFKWVPEPQHETLVSWQV